ncbi:uncharacterized protein LAESUDRAFT_258490 [Laetiporus sulphureus 93-53]|uniref:Uncharacterized protein n=1 Tax=Laetiporus sulphureus 93-53 TaxID=1314785 RepID=A0A165H447_9APHY|nr:uncharacterized protein LAESUDRAFT_258490 [Laetiporus sulphureus 93-53]KZT11216.1 hypothetical protein LAESUDRAFT_258490 [Laetiporus sulphureus 93-53]
MIERSSSKHHSADAPDAPPCRPSTQSSNLITSGATPAASPHSRPHDTIPNDDHHLHAFMKSISDRRSPHSSNERIVSPEDGGSSRPTAHARSKHAAIAGTVQASTSGQPYQAVTGQGTRDPSRPREREREREKDRDRRHGEKEKEKKRTKDSKSEKVKGLEKVKERDRDNEQRRERHREKDRSGMEKDVLKEKDKEKDRLGRKRDDRRVVERGTVSVSQPTQGPPTTQGAYISAERYTASVGRHAGQILQTRNSFTADPTGAPAPPYMAPQLNPSNQTINSGRPPDPRRTPRAVPLSLTAERDRPSSRPHRTHRVKVSGYQSGQESGMSSSEQEYPARERYRTPDRRREFRELYADGYGHSGSEAERASLRERRPRHVHGDSGGQVKTGPTTDSATRLAAGQISQQPGMVQDSSGGWHHSKTRESPARRPAGLAQLPSSVRIRAGEGPADPQTPLLIPKSSSTTTVNRPQDPTLGDRGTYDAHARPRTGSQPTQQSMPQSAPATTNVYPQYASVRATHAGEGANRGYEAAGAHNQSAPNTDYTQKALTYEQSQLAAAIGQPHPVQQAIRSLEGIERPSTSRTAVPASNGMGTGHFYDPSPMPVVMQQLAKGDERTRRHRSAQDVLSSTNQRNAAQAVPAAGLAQSAAYHGYPQNSNLEAQRSEVPTVPAQSGVPVGVQHPQHRAGSAPPAERAHVDPAGLSVQYATYQANAVGQIHGPHSPKAKPIPAGAQAVAVAQATFSPSPVQPSRTVPKDSPGYPAGTLQDRSGQIQAQRPTHAKSSSVPNLAAAARSPPISPGYSPSRQTLTRSPVVNSLSPPNTTPKHSASARLQGQRKGSNDTITGQTTPRAVNVDLTQQQLMHRSSGASLRHDAPSRPETTPTARLPNLLPGYPEPARYRSPAPPQYPSVPVVTSIPSASSSTVPSNQHSQSYSTQTPNGAARPPFYPNMPAPAHNPTNSPGRDPTTSAGQSAQDVPAGNVPHRLPRSATSPAPVGSQRQYQDGLSVMHKSHSVPVPSSSHRTVSNAPPTGRRPDLAPFPTSSHPRTGSDPHQVSGTGRVPKKPPFLHVRTRPEPQSGSGHAEQDVLLTPSSLALTLPQQQSTTAGFAPSSNSKDKSPREKESRKKGGFFSLFRSKSNSPKEDARPTIGAMQQRRRKESAPSSSTAPAMTNLVRYATNPTPRSGDQAASKNNATAAGRNASAAPTGRKSPGSKMFSPFRLISKRNRTLSVASLEAVDGTVTRREVLLPDG